VAEVFQTSHAKCVRHQGFADNMQKTESGTSQSEDCDVKAVRGVAKANNSHAKPRSRGGVFADVAREMHPGIEAVQTVYRKPKAARGQTVDSYAKKADGVVKTNNSHAKTRSRGWVVQRSRTKRISAPRLCNERKTENGTWQTVDSFVETADGNLKTSMTAARRAKRNPAPRLCR